jgi:transposase
VRRIRKQSGGIVFPTSAESLYYPWSKESLEVGKQRLAGDTARQATSPEVKELRSETTALKEVVADLALENRSSGN